MNEFDHQDVHPVTGQQDTDDAAAAVQRELFRRAGPTGRIRAAASLSDAVVRLARQSMRTAMPAASDLDIALALLAKLHGAALAGAVRAHLDSGAPRP
jgi:hypothetical protein